MVFGFHLKFHLINCKVEWKFKWIKYCILSAAGAFNNDTNSEKIIFTIKETKQYVPVVTLSTKDNKKLSKLVSQRFKRTVYCKEYKIKIRIEIRQINTDFFSNQTLLKLISYLLWFVQSKMAIYKKSKTRRFYFPKGVIDHYNVIVSGRNSYDQAIDSDIKRYK